ncbi:TauD/TfdA dioxygenase family protein [Paeniroseomonas aquatica]|uniref:TauD/TfdA dioxygenase family protein n=1 Tax=Paeniroseomonas aquatica TaxID=373043 RepID=UPI003609BFC2
MDIQPRFAAEVTGLDLAGPIDAATLEVLHDAFLDHAVLLFRGEQAEAGARASFAGRLAALERPLLDRGSPPLPPVLRAVGGDPPGETPPPGDALHADHSHAAEPSIACIAQAAGPEARYGEIAFADQRAALEGLPPGLRQRAEELRAEHRHAGQRAEHPVVRSHPITGAPSLFVNPAFTTRILNLPQAESDRLLARLFAAATAPPVTWRHGWEAGDLLLWDNRAVLHTGSPATALHRTRIEGDRPLGLRAMEMPWVVAG